MAKRDIKALLSSENDRWMTPVPLFERLDLEFGFTLDAAAEFKTTQVPNNYFALDHKDPTRRDAMACCWADYAGGGAVWLNPPYGRGVGAWVRRAYLESRKGVTVCVLIFARTETLWWDEFALGCADEIRYIKGRVTFWDPDTQQPRRDKKGSPQAATAPSALLVFRPHWNGPPRHISMRQHVG